MSIATWKGQQSAAGGGGALPIATTMQSSVTKGLVTWTFSAPVPVGFYPNGDPFVLNSSGVTVTACTPDIAVLPLDTWKMGTQQTVAVDATTDTCTLTAHGLFEGFPIKFSQTLYGINSGRVYFVRNPTANTFQLTDSVASNGNRWGAIFNITGTGNILTQQGSRTATAFSGSTVTCASHKLLVGRKIIFITLTGSTGLSVGVDYWIVGTVAANTFQLASTKGGSAIAFGGAGTGVFEIYGITNRTINGMMANPGNLSPTYGGTGILSSNHGGQNAKQAFDSIDTADGPDGSTNQDYDDTLLVGGASLPFPRVYSAGQEVSLVKTVAMRDVWFDDISPREATKSMEVLTIVNTVPIEGSFRPSPSLTSKAAPALRSQVDLSFLPNISTAGVPINETITDLPQVFNNCWMTFYTANLFTRAITAYANQGQQNYGRGMAYDLSEAWQLLCLNYTLAEKQALAYGILQVALDHYGRSVEGGDWPGGTASVGGGSHHVPGFATFAALALSATAIGPGLSAWAQGSTLGAKFQAFYPEQLDVDIPRAPWTVTIAPFQPPMKGSPAFQSIYSYATEGSVYASSSPNGPYAATVTVSNAGIINGALLSTGAQTMYNRQEWFDYTRYWYNIIPGISQNAETASPLTIHFKNNLIPAYNAAVPTRTGVFGQGNWVWAKYDRLLDTAVENNIPAVGDFDVRVNGGGSAAVATVVSRTTSGTTNPVSGGDQTMTLTSVAGVAVGHRVVHANIPPDCRVAAINGLILVLSRALNSSVASGQSVSFSPIAIDGFSLGIRLDTPLVIGDTLTMAYTSGAKPARSIANTNVASFTATAGVNETGALPPAATTKQFVRNDLEPTVATNQAVPVVTGKAWQVSPVPPTYATTYDRILFGIRMKNNGPIVANDSYFSDAGNSTFRIASPTTATTRIIVLASGSIRPTNVWSGGREVDGAETTHWVRIDMTTTVLADAYKYLVNNVVGTQSSSAIWPGAAARTFTINDFFPAGAAAWASSVGLNASDAGIQEVFMHFSSSALPNPEDPLNTQFAPSFDWGGNGENVLGFAPLFYWAFNADDCNSGVTINRGSGGPGLTLYNPVGGANGGIDLEALQPFGVL